MHAEQHSKDAPRSEKGQIDYLILSLFAGTSPNLGRRKLLPREGPRPLFTAAGCLVCSG